ncbi:oxygenase MpaB family protein [Pseudomonas sp. NCHU5208]|uniref:oxygenase MpaB family protein n=1 Tax=unclassified Pseudomonas TaxID=196821 RepID=UPI003F972942
MSAESTTAFDKVEKVISKEKLYGKESRWRRYGEPTLAASAEKVDHGVYGPGSVAWDVVLHPATMVFQSAAQFALQLTYKPVHAGVRDWDPISRKARKGTLTIFDLFDRTQRNSGIHAPMWLGDSVTAKKVAKHLGNIHSKVVGDCINIAEPDLGGYDANSPRESMWAAITEMHSMLWVYESLAFRGLKFPSRMLPEKRDQFFAEVAEYCKLFPHEEKVPASVEEIKAHYERDKRLFGMPSSIDIIPETGQSFKEVVEESMKKNWHPSQRKVKFQLFLHNKLFNIPVYAALSGKTRRNMGIPASRDKWIFLGKTLLLPFIWLIQQPPIERYFMRIMWGPDAVKLIMAARKLHAEAKKKRGWD